MKGKKYCILAKKYQLSAALIQNGCYWADKTYQLSLNPSLSVCDYGVCISVFLWVKTLFIFPSALAVTAMWFAVNQSWEADDVCVSVYFRLPFRRDISVLYFYSYAEVLEADIVADLAGGSGAGLGQEKPPVGANANLVDRLPGPRG